MHASLAGASFPAELLHTRAGRASDISATFPLRARHAEAGDLDARAPLALCTGR